MREQRGDLEQLLQGVGADHAGLLEEGVDADVRPGAVYRAATATIGFSRATVGASCANLRGLPKLSR